VRSVLLAILAAAILTGGVGSWFASHNPDGLEWAIAGVTGKQELAVPHLGLHDALASFQEKTAFLPDYSFRQPSVPMAHPAENGAEGAGGNMGTSVAGIVGALLTLGIALLIGCFLRRRPQRA